MDVAAALLGRPWLLAAGGRHGLVGLANSAVALFGSAAGARWEDGRLFVEDLFAIQCGLPRYFFHDLCFILCLYSCILILSFRSFSWCFVLVLIVVLLFMSFCIACFLFFLDNVSVVCLHLVLLPGCYCDGGRYRTSEIEPQPETTSVAPAAWRTVAPGTFHCGPATARASPGGRQAQLGVAPSSIAELVALTIALSQTSGFRAGASCT